MMAGGFLDSDNRLNIVLPMLPGVIAAAIKKSISIGNRFEEIRLRRGMPVGVTSGAKSLFLLSTGRLSATHENAVICSSDEFEYTALKICDNSVFAHTKEIESGYISVCGGIRVGVCGDFSPTISGITSLNIRIPRQVKGCADEALSYFSGGMLLAGAPGSGKTTMLRDLIRKLSEEGYRISVIDSRREISGGTEKGFDLGPNTDVSFLSDKAFGATCALKTMFPQIIAFDEIGSSSEVKSILEAFNSGVYILTTAHAANLTELTKREVTKTLIDSGVLKNIVLLSENIGEAPQVYSIEEINNEYDY